MNERRYKEEEVRKIFGLAARGSSSDRRTISSADGLTLAEIQGIGREVGLEPAAVAHAAAEFDAQTLRARRRKSLGMPIEVGRVVPLPRALTDHEWEQLVTELRATFGARGTIRSEGNLREWFNGNLHACVEPAEGGYRLRMGTLKSDARGVNAMGATGILTSAIVAGSLAVSGALGEAIFVPVIFSAFGIGAFIANMVRLPRWAQQREQQMEYIAKRIAAIVKEG